MYKWNLCMFLNPSVLCMFLDFLFLRMFFFVWFSECSLSCFLCIFPDLFIFWVSLFFFSWNIISPCFLTHNLFAHFLSFLSRTGPRECHHRILREKLYRVHQISSKKCHGTLFYDPFLQLRRALWWEVICSIIVVVMYDVWYVEFIWNFFLVILCHFLKALGLETHAKM